MVINMINLTKAPLLADAKKARHKPNIILQILIFFAVFISSNIITGLIIGIPMAATMLKSIDASLIAGADARQAANYAMESISKMPEWLMVLMLFATAATTICTVIYCRKIEGRSFSSMGMRKDGFLKKCGMGYIIGILMISAAVGLSMVLGATRFGGFDSRVSWFYIGLFLLGFIVQGMSEEVLVRGYFMVSCANRVHIALALGLSSVLFAALHLANNGITALSFINLVLFGVFTGAYMLRTNDLWGVCAIHASWNFVQGHIFGISVSGTVVSSSVFSTVLIEGKELVSGGSFGIEGGICTSAVLIAATALVMFLPQKKPYIYVASPEEERPQGKKREPMNVYIEK
ncbi:MAG: CPBP family intramembrane metalloprotease [Clostridiales bacterium]|nr:CPBP family intramembrane metalloprotease [Clostridiales bacterium]